MFIISNKFETKYTAIILKYTEDNTLHEYF